MRGSARGATSCCPCATWQSEADRALRRSATIPLGQAEKGGRVLESQRGALRVQRSVFRAGPDRMGVNQVFVAQGQVDRVIVTGGAWGLSHGEVLERTYRPPRLPAVAPRSVA